MRWPKSAVVAVTYRCDSRCIMCNIWKAGGGEELPPEVFGRLPASLAVINITGGEPFLRQDLAELIRVIKKKCRSARMVISTNGLRPHSMEAQLKEIMRFEPGIGVRISLDGMGKMHDVVRGTSGAYDRAMESAEVLNKLEIEDRGFAFTILDRNAHQLKAVYDLSRTLGMQLAVSIAQGSAIYFQIEGVEPKVDASVICGHLEQVVSDQMRRWNVKDWFRAYLLEGLYSFYKGKSPLLGCSAADDFFFLDPAGNIYICPMLDMKLGNIRESPFEDVWNSAATCEARKYAASCPRRCWMACTVTPFIKRHLLSVLLWIAVKKTRAHLGQKIIEP